MKKIGYILLALLICSTEVDAQVTSRNSRSNSESELGKVIVKGIGNLFKKKDKTKKVESNSTKKEKKDKKGRERVVEQKLSNVANKADSTASLSNEASIDGNAFLTAKYKKEVDAIKAQENEIEQKKQQRTKMEDSVLFDYNITVGKPTLGNVNESIIIPFVICCKTTDNFNAVFKNSEQDGSISIPLELLLKFKIVDNLGEYPFYVYNSSKQIESGSKSDHSIEQLSVVGITPSWWLTSPSWSGTDRWLRINTPQRTIDEIYFINSEGKVKNLMSDIYDNRDRIVNIYGRLNDRLSNITYDLFDPKKKIYGSLISLIKIQDYNVLICGKMRYTVQQLSQLSKISVLPVNSLKEGTEIEETKYYYEGKYYSKYDVYDDEIDCIKRGYENVRVTQSVIEKIKKMQGTDKQEDALYSGIYKVVDKKGDQVFFKLDTTQTGVRVVRIKYVNKNGKDINYRDVEYTYWGTWTVTQFNGNKAVKLSKDRDKRVLRNLHISFYNIAGDEAHSTVYMVFRDNKNITLYIKDDDKTNLEMAKISSTTGESTVDEQKELNILQQDAQKAQQQQAEKASALTSLKNKAPGIYKITDKKKTTYIKLTTDGKAFYRYEGTCLGKSYHNSGYSYYGSWKAEKYAGQYRIQVEEDLDKAKHIYLFFPCSNLIEEMQWYSHLAFYLDRGQVYGGRCNSPLQFYKIE